MGQFCVGSLLAGWYDGHQTLEEGTQVHCVDIVFDFVASLFFWGVSGFCAIQTLEMGFTKGS